MYIPKLYRVDDQARIFSFVRENAFGQLVSNVNGRPHVTHMPFLLSADESTLSGHLAIGNPQHAELEEREVLITFQGPHDYISPSWYNSPTVPTWNYQAVHIYGRCKVYKTPEKLKQAVDALTAEYEQGFAEPWVPDYKASKLRGIVGVEIKITDIECQFKLDQGQTADEIKNIATQLEARGELELANAMRAEIK